MNSKATGEIVATYTNAAWGYHEIAVRCSNRVLDGRIVGYVVSALDATEECGIRSAAHFATIEEARAAWKATADALKAKGYTFVRRTSRGTMSSAKAA